ncbi:MAG: hypothetical protein ACJ8EL_09675 [Rhizomicrobium sp.]|jgi:hypothetical protein
MGRPSGSDLHITNNQLQGGDNSLGYYKKSSGDSQVSATVYLNGTGLQLGAVATGDIASGNNAYAKIQEQNGSGCSSTALSTSVMTAVVHSSS